MAGVACCFLQKQCYPACQVATARASRASDCTSVNIVQEVLQQAPCQRSDADLAPVLVLLQYIPLFAPLCSEAQRCIAAHAKLLELTDGVEMPRRVAQL